MKKLSVEESKTMLHKMVEAGKRFKGYMPVGGSNVNMTVIPEFFDACALALEALDDIEEMATAVYRYEETCGFTKREKIDANYADAYTIAEKWYSKEHITRKSIIKTQLEGIINGFNDPVSYDELVKVIQEMKGDDT